GEKEEEERGREKKSRDADHYTKIEKTSQDPEEDKNGAVQRRGNAESIQSRKRKSCQHEDQEEEKDVEEQRDAFETSGCRDWVISTLPLCMGSYICIEKLPRLIIDLVARVDWEDEKNCLKDISLLLASFFTSLPSEEEGLRTARQAKGDEESKVAERVGDGCSSSQNSPNSNEATCARPEINRIHERYFLPALRTYWKGLLPKRFYEDGTIQVIASLPALYRVFERC
ncbi:dna mismatch repair c-terminal domain-containing protein, partial [Cystoisospora suis]